MALANLLPRPQLISWSGGARSSPATIGSFSARFPTSRKLVSCSSITHCNSEAKPKVASPWLMLPPSLDGTDIVYDLYSLADDKVHSYHDEDGPNEHAELLGSSHGWIVSYNVYNDKLFLSNPLLDDHKELPSTDSYVKNVVLSSPNPYWDEDCRAVMIHSGGLAFCCPTRDSSDWTTIVTNFGYSSVVYSTFQKRFFCFNDLYESIESWDLKNPNSPWMIPMNNVDDVYDWPVACSSKQQREAQCSFNSSTFLAIAEASDDLYQVRRFTVTRMAPDGSHVRRMNFGESKVTGNFPYKTTDFDVYKYDKEERDWKYMDGSLDGLAIFIGKNHGFALPAADYPELKPDAVYFTDVRSNGHDIGIFNYRNKTISPCYYPCDYNSTSKHICPAPFWFTPTENDSS